MKIVTAAEMRAIDRATSERFGVPSLTLMENAGAAVAERVQLSWQAGEKIVVVCGKGNNGGDGFVAARLLHEKGKPVQVVLLADPAGLKGDAAEMYTRLPFAPTIVRTSEELKSEQVRQCLVKQWFRYANGRTEVVTADGSGQPVASPQSDTCTLERLYQSFEDSGHDMRELVVQIALSDAFRYRSMQGGGQ